MTLLSLVPATPVLGMIFLISVIWIPAAYITERKEKQI